MEDQIAKARSGDSETEERHPNADLQPTPIHRPRSWLLPVAVTSGVAAVGGAGVWWLLWASRAFDSVTDSLTFVTGGIFTLALFLVALVQACVYWSQRGVMKQQWQVMQGQLETINKQEGHLAVQAQAAKHAADEMVKASQHAEQALRISQRAYVGLKMHPTMERTEDNHPVVTLYFINAGHTPAKRCELWFEYGLTSSATVFQDYRKGFTIAAHVDKSIDCECPNVTFDPDSSEAFFYFRGQLRYVDAWEEAQAAPFHYFYSRKTLALEEFYVRNPRHDPRH